MKLSIVSPVYNAAATLHELVERCVKSLPEDFDSLEIILIDDFSRDESWSIIEKLCESDIVVMGIKLSRNFGQHYAITAGLEHVTGDWIVVMDCDLQDQPEEIEKLYAKTKEGLEVVFASRLVRQDKWLKKWYSAMFYKSLSWLTGLKQDASIANFGIYSRRVIDNVVAMPEKVRYFPTMIRWIGFPSAKVKVEHASRKEGKSNYNLRKSLKLATDIILANSDKPLRMIVKFGLFVALVSFFFVLRTVYLWAIGAIEVLGYASLIVSIWFLSGCMMATLGILGLYIGKIFDNVKNRPLYVIEKYAGNKKT